MAFEPGEMIRVIDGPFNDFSGVVEEIDQEKSKSESCSNDFWKINSSRIGLHANREKLMAKDKEIITYIKLQVPAACSFSSPPVGPALGQHGVNLMDFCNAFNSKTNELEKMYPFQL